MSVLLTAARTRNKNEPKSAKPKKKKRHAQVRRVEVPESTPGLKVWLFDMANNTVKVIFRKDTMEVWRDNEKIETEDNFSDVGATYDFKIYDLGASIQTRFVDGRLDHVLMVDGYLVEEYKEEDYTSNGHAHGAHGSNEYSMAMANGVHDVTLEEKKSA